MNATILGGGFGATALWFSISFSIGSARADELELPLTAKTSERIENIQRERSEPFCYFLIPSDEIGFKDCPEGTQVTHDGAFQTAFGELDLFVGLPARRVQARVKTLVEGSLPIVTYEFDRDGCLYRVEAFATTIDLDPRENLINFVRIVVENRTPIPLQAEVAGAFVEPHGKGREKLGCPGWYRDKFMNASAFANSKTRSTEAGTAYQGDHVLFTSSAGTGLSLVENEDRQSSKVTYRGDVAPGASASVTFKFPYVPIDRGNETAFEDFLSFRFEEALSRTKTFWKDILESAAVFDVQETKVVETLEASLIYDLIARDIGEDGKSYVQKVSDIHYDAFWVRDGAFIVRGYDLLGLHEIAEETIGHFLLYDKKGNVTKFRGHQPDSWGQSLWTVGSHYRLTGDVGFAKRIYAAIPPHIEVLIGEMAKDPLGIWPDSPPYDNEAINGHYTGHNFWALLGLKEAIHLARATGHQNDAEQFVEIFESYEKRVMAAIERMTSQTEGYIPPGLDAPLDGFDWANASAGQYPFHLLAPDHPWVTATLATVREYKYREGIMTYGPNAWAVKQREREGLFAPPGRLHHYETMYVTQGLLRRGEQRKVLEDFYSTLVHTGSTHAGFEWGIAPWGDRDPGGNLPPHGWFAARYIALIRNMLVREEGEDLHLLGAISPAWLDRGGVITVRRAPTEFGPISFTLESTESGAELRIRSSFRNAPRKLILHKPWFVEIDEVEIDGSKGDSDGEFLELPAGTKRVTLGWRIRERPALSFEDGVTHYLQKYWDSRPEQDPGFLFPRPSRPRVLVDEKVFIEKIDVTIVASDAIGEVRYTLDGSNPGPSSKRLPQLLRLEKTTTLRALTVFPDGRVSVPIEVTFEKVRPRKACGVEGTTPGLRFELFLGQFSKLPEFDELKPAKNGVKTAIDLQSIGAPESNFAVRFRGYIEVPKTGIYGFSTASDDGSQLFIGDQLVVDNDGLHPRQEERGSLALDKGQHPITVTFFERGGAESLTVKWKPPGGEWEELPEKRFLQKGFSRE